MNLAEILVYTDIRQLHQIAGHYGCTCNPHSKNELITTLLVNLRNRQMIQAEIGRLGSAELHFLLLLFLDRRTRFSFEELLAKASLALETYGDRSGAEGRAFIATALKRGWIFPAKSSVGGQFQVPVDIREPYLKEWLGHWQAEAGEEETSPLAYRDEGTALCDDIWQFLQFLSKEPVPLTADGGMYKRYQSQLLKFLSVKEEPLAAQKWRFGYGLHFDLYPDRFSLLYDYCYYQRWIEEYPDRVELSERGREQLKQPYSDQTYHDLIRFWLRLYKRAIPNLPMLVVLIPLLAGNGWVSQERLKRTLLGWIKPFYYDDAESVLVNRVLKMMVHLGLLKAGQASDGDWLYTGTCACQTWLRQHNGFAETTIMLK